MKRAGFIFGILLLFLTNAANAAENDDLRRIEEYLNSITTLKTDFTASFPDGFNVEGKAYLSRPGKMHLDYGPPTSVLVIADGRFLIHYDKELKQASWVGLSEAPVVELLVRPKISLDDDDIEVVRVEKSAQTIDLYLKLLRAPPEQQKMMMTFSTAPMQLLQWIEQDTPYGDVVVRFNNMSINIPLPSDLFVFKDPRFNDPLSSRRRSF